jgi:hypothetical protein
MSRLAERRHPIHHAFGHKTTWYHLRSPARWLPYYVSAPGLSSLHRIGASPALASQTKSPAGELAAQGAGGAQPVVPGEVAAGRYGAPPYISYRPWSSPALWTKTHARIAGRCEAGSGWVPQPAMHEHAAYMNILYRVNNTVYVYRKCHH